MELAGRFLELTFVAIIIAMVLVNSTEFSRVMEALAGAYTRAVGQFTSVRAI